MKDVDNKECKKHGITRHYRRKDHGTGNNWKCNKCNREAVRKVRNTRKDKILELKGSKCSVCGYDRCKNALAFHHLDPTKKDFQLDKNSMGDKSWEEILAEVDKCALLCHNCHSEVHAGLIEVGK